MLPPGSSNLPETRRAAVSSLFGLASDGVYTAASVTRSAVSSYLAFSPLPAIAGGYFLLHLPGSHLHRTLSGILPYEARTFLTCSLSAFAAAIVCATHYRSILSCRKKKVKCMKWEYFLFGNSSAKKNNWQYLSTLIVLLSTFLHMHLPVYFWQTTLI